MIESEPTTTEDREREGWWWIDYLENEMDPGLEKDLQLLLEHSQEDRDLFESFRLLKEWLGESDPVGGWPLEARTANVRKNVMSAIAAIDVKSGSGGYPAGTAARETKSLRV